MMGLDWAADVAGWFDFLVTLHDIDQLDLLRHYPYTS